MAFVNKADIDLLSNDNIEVLNYISDTSVINKQIRFKYNVRELVLGNEDIDLSSISALNGFNLKYNRSGTGNLRIILSPNSGVTWFVFDGNTFNTIDISNIDNVRDNGMTPEVFNSIPGAVIINLIRSTFTFNTLRFGYYLEEIAESDIANTDELELKVQMQGTWAKAEHLVDYNYMYLNNTLLSVHLYKDGSYKINY